MNKLAAADGQAFLPSSSTMAMTTWLLPPMLQSAAWSPRASRGATHMVLLPTRWCVHPVRGHVSSWRRKRVAVIHSVSVSVKGQMEHSRGYITMDINVQNYSKTSKEIK